MHKYINNHRIHTLVALDQEDLYYVHETRVSANTSCANIITIFRSAPMKNANPGILSTVRILYPPRMAGHSEFVHHAVCMGENLLRNAIDRDMSPIEAIGFFKKRYEEGINCYGNYFKDNYDGIHMNAGAGLFPYGLGDGTITIKLYFGRFNREDILEFNTVRELLLAPLMQHSKQVDLLHCAPPNLKKLCDSFIDIILKYNVNIDDIPVVSITREAVKEYNELEAKYQSACGQISEYEEENRKLKEKLEEISKLVKSATPDREPKECLKFMGEE